MLAQTVVCPSCRTELKIKANVLAGRTAAPCPVCKASIPIASSLQAPSDTDASVADRTQRALTDPPLPAVFAFLSPPRAPDEIGRLAHYRILNELGRGGMGVVFRAEDTHLKRPVALKVMLPQYASNPTDKARFLREARTQAQIEHDHVVTIFQVGEDRGVAFLAMPLLKGMNLAEALRANARVPLPSAVRIAREVAEGLAAAHANGLIHRDIKPGNIFLEGKHLRVKILDFGLARVAEVPASEAVTQQGAVVGTPAYMSPEQARGEHLDARSDLFSLGTVLYQMLTGKQPFRGSSTTGVLIAVATENPPPPATVTPGVPPTLDALVMALLAKNPGLRPPTAEDVAGHLRAVEAELRGSNPSGPVSGVGYVAVPLLSAATTGPWAELDATETDNPEVKPVVSHGRHLTTGRHSAVAAPSKAKANANAKAAPQRAPSRKPFVLAAALGLVLALGLAAVAAYLATDTGTVLVEVNDAETESRYRNGRLVLTGGGKDRYTLAATDRALSAATGTYTARVEGADGLTVEPREFAVRRGEKTVVRLGRVKTPVVPPVALPPVALPPGEADRKGAEYVLRSRGTVRVNNGTFPIKQAAQLPPDPFRLTHVQLTDSDATDDGLAALKDCREVNTLLLSRSPVTDAGLVHFKDWTELRELWAVGSPIGDGVANFKNCKNLNVLNLFETRVGDDGLAALRACKDELVTLNLGNNPRVTDAGLAHYKGITGLTFLNLTGTGATEKGVQYFAANKRLRGLWLKGLPLTDTTLAPFADCEGLREVSLADTRLSDAGAAHLRGAKGLTDLWLNGTALTDEGFAHFAGCRGLMRLYVGGTRLTDAGLAHFAASQALGTLNAFNTALTDDAVDALCRFTALTYLNVAQTKITASGVDRLRKALPNCTIEWNGGTDAPAGMAVAAGGAADRAAAEYMISVGGSFRVSGETKTRRTGPLPAGPFSVTYVHLLDNKAVTDAGLVAFKGCRDVGYLSLSRTAVTDKGLECFKDCTKLTSLHAYRTGITDKGLENFSGITTLGYLNVGGTAVTDAGLENFKGCRNLMSLNAWETKVTDAGLAHFKDCTKLTAVSVYSTGVTDAGLEHLKGCANLIELTINDTKVTDAGLAHFKNSKSLQRVSVGGLPVTDKGLENFKDCAKLTKLSAPGTKVTDAGMALFADRKSLTYLSLSRTEVTDKGLENFKGCQLLTELYLSEMPKVTDAGLAQVRNYTNLSEVNLDGTQITDKTLERLAECRTLTLVDVRKTKVTAGGVAELHRALPGCKIEWNGGTVLPKLP